MHIPLFKKASSLILFSNIEALNSIEEKYTVNFVNRAKATADDIIKFFDNKAQIRRQDGNHLFVSDKLEFRKTLGQFVTGVTIVTTCNEDGTPRGFTANSFTSVSLDPPIRSFLPLRRSMIDFVARCGYGGWMDGCILRD